MNGRWVGWLILLFVGGLLNVTVWHFVFSNDGDNSDDADNNGDDDDDVLQFVFVVVVIVVHCFYFAASL